MGMFGLLSPADFVSWELVSSLFDPDEACDDLSPGEKMGGNGLWVPFGERPVSRR